MEINNTNSALLELPSPGWKKNKVSQTTTEKEKRTGCPGWDSWRRVPQAGAGSTQWSGEHRLRQRQQQAPPSGVDRNEGNRANSRWERREPGNRQPLQRAGHGQRRRSTSHRDLQVHKQLVIKIQTREGVQQVHTLWRDLLRGGFVISTVWTAPGTYQELIRFFLGTNTRDSEWLIRNSPCALLRH